MTYTVHPIRYPDVRSRAFMGRRAWWLVWLNLLMPGSAQVLAGSRRLGRFGLSATILLWVLLAGFVAGWFLAAHAVRGLFTNSWFLATVATVLVAYAVVWLVLTFDTLRLVRFVYMRGLTRLLVGVFAVIALVATTGCAGYAAYAASVATGFLNRVFTAGPLVPPDNDGYYNILLLGGDSGPDRDGLRPDSTSVLSVNANTGQIINIGIPRDLQNVPFRAGSPMAAKYPKGYGVSGCDVDVCQFNSIYTEALLKSPQLYPDAAANHSNAGIEATRDAVAGITGLTIQYMVLLDMQGFSDLVDALGGVTVTVTAPIPISGDPDHIGAGGWIQPGTQKLNGYNALWYARARYGIAGGDYARMQRQRGLEQAILQQFTPAAVLTKFQSLASVVADSVKTDIPQSMLNFFVDLASKAKQLAVKNVELVPDNNVDTQNPDYVAIGRMVQDARA